MHHANSCNVSIVRILFIALLALAAPGGPLLLGAQEVPLSGFNPFWARQKDGGTSGVDEAVKHDGKASVRIAHAAEQDWSLTCKNRIDCQAGDIFEMSAWIRKSGEGDASLCAIASGSDGKARDFMLGRKSAPVADDFKLVRTRMVIPDGVTTITPRLAGHGQVTAWIEGMRLARLGNVRQRLGKTPEVLSAVSPLLAVKFKPASGTLHVTDQRTGKTWDQQAVSADVVVTAASEVPGGIDATIYHAANDLSLRVAIRIEQGKAEVTLAMAGESAAPMEATLAWPGPFLAAKPAYLVIPMNEGISYPVEDESIAPMRLTAYTGHGICMSFYGVTDGAAGQMTILETPDDANIQIARVEKNLCVHPIWLSELQKFGYARQVRFVFFDKGGHVAMAKRYREHARQIGLFKTLEQKRREVPAVDLLVGAVNVWYFDQRGAVSMAKEMQSAGIDRMLWSAANKPEALSALNAMPGVLSSRYDIYQDVMDPAMFPRLRYIHGDWTTEGFPKHIIRDVNGKAIPGWKVEDKEGNMIPCAVLCDREAIPYAQKRIGNELKTHPYRSRFIDTTTASGWRECYDPAHLMTRRQSHEWKMKLLGVVSGEFKLVCGSETGQDAAVPTTHYFEGMLSLGHYRVPDSGRKMQVILDEVPERVAKFQVGHAYRLPLWELVYHDCVVAQWYWGDYNNKLPAIWDKRDQFNALYGTPGMFMFNRKFWDANKERFVKSYKTWGPIVRATGYSAMTDHRFLTPDRAVQQTAFANGVRVTVNFGDRPYALAGGVELAPGAVHAEGMK